LLYGKYNPGWYPLAAFESGARLVAITTRNQVGRGDRRQLLAIAANKGYKSLDKIQCEVAFRPTTFTVAVHPINRTISVHPKTGADDPDPTDTLRDHALSNIESIAKTETTIWTSTVGNALTTSFKTLWASQYGSESIPSDISDGRRRNTTLRAVELSLEAMLDDVLVRMTSAAIARDQDVKETETRGMVAAVRIGGSAYVYANLGIHILALFLVFVVALLHQFWSQTTVFDYADPIALAMGVCIESKATEGSTLDELHLKDWDGDQGAAAVKCLEICKGDDGRAGFELRRKI
jgi:hypothetical protein